MALNLCVLGSGSSGNCIYVGSDHTHILIDAGLSMRQIAARLRESDRELESITAVCVTHEHSDHTSGLATLHRRLGMDIYANSGTIEAINLNGKLAGLPWNVFTTGSPFQVGDLRLEPFSVPHDSYDPVGYCVSSGEARVGVVTDMGLATGLVRERLRSCQAVVVEANHDEHLLRDAERPWSLKQRIAGRQGHLSNAQAGELLADIAGPGLTTAYLAHLSSDCNRPDLACRAVSDALGSDNRHVSVRLTYADRSSEMLSIP